MVLFLLLLSILSFNNTLITTTYALRLQPYRYVDASPSAPPDERRISAFTRKWAIQGLLDSEITIENQRRDGLFGFLKSVFKGTRVRVDAKNQFVNAEGERLQNFDDINPFMNNKLSLNSNELNLKPFTFSLKIQ